MDRYTVVEMSGRKTSKQKPQTRIHTPNFHAAQLLAKSMEKDHLKPQIYDNSLRARIQ